MSPLICRTGAAAHRLTRVHGCGKSKGQRSPNGRTDATDRNRIESYKYVSTGSLDRRQTGNPAEHPDSLWQPLTADRQLVGAPRQTLLSNFQRTHSGVQHPLIKINLGVARIENRYEIENLLLV